MEYEIIKLKLSKLPGWELSQDKTSISRRFQFKGFLKTMSFLNAMAWVVNQENHHPEFSAGFNYCIINFTTHDGGALTELDFICASRVSALVDEL